MKKELLLIVSVLLLIICSISGCFGPEGTKVENPFEGITFESKIVELVNASLVLHKDRNVITKANVKYLFHNIAGKTVDVKVIVEFYDINNYLLATRGPKYISIPKDYTETVYSPANVISYKGEKVSEVNHVRIIAEE
jgi:hypothetical protein